MKEEVSNCESTDIPYDQVEGRVKFIQGKVLTVIEATIANDNQLKAAKDLIKHIFSEQLTQLYNNAQASMQMLTEGDMTEFGGGDIEEFYENNQATE